MKKRKYISKRVEWVSNGYGGRKKVYRYKYPYKRKKKGFTRFFEIIMRGL